LQFDANFAEAHNSMGIVYDKQHNTPQAIAAFEQYVRLNPNDKKTFFAPRARSTTPKNNTTKPYKPTKKP
jgi:regulator of sirC expression with transglutaminase-like and TPR domain